MLIKAGRWLEFDFHSRLIILEVIALANYIRQVMKNE